MVNGSQYCDSLGSHRHAVSSKSCCRVKLHVQHASNLFGLNPNFDQVRTNVTLRGSSVSGCCGRVCRCRGGEVSVGAGAAGEFGVDAGFEISDAFEHHLEGRRGRREHTGRNHRPIVAPQTIE